jgi:S1-C subfamily serine protease
VSAQLIEQGYFSYPYIGIRWQWLTPQITQRYNLPVDYGVYVSYIEPNGPADDSGLREGDIITRMGDRVLDEDHPFINVLYGYSPGETSTLEIVRESGTIEAEITFSERPIP